MTLLLNKVMPLNESDSSLLTLGSLIILRKPLTNIFLLYFNPCKDLVGYRVINCPDDYHTISTSINKFISVSRIILRRPQKVGGLVQSSAQSRINTECRPDFPFR